jgi:triosephosphate isomerase (TIM)
MRKKLLLGNWKMNKTTKEAKEFASLAFPLIEVAHKGGIDIGVAPTYTSLETVKTLVPGLIVAAQNCHYETNGAFTGEISIPMLLDLGINWVIIGHSERRTYDNETNVKCNKKLVALLKNNMVPVYCCGESLELFESGSTKVFVKTQIIEGFAGISKEDAKKVVIAYEPIWSIGTGKNASKEIAEDVCKFIRDTINELYGKEVSTVIRILYGGSVKPTNIKEYLSQNDIDGALVGGASLKIDSYKELIENMIG